MGCDLKGRRLAVLAAACAFIFVGLCLVLGRCEIITVRANAAVGVECGLASVYGVRGDGQAGHGTASGARMVPEALTAAHRTLPMGTIVAVRSMRHLGVRGAPAVRVLVKINDRGPFVRGRVIDLSPAAAAGLGFADDLLPVCLDVVRG
jgi:rare lipoprotein A